MRKQNLQKELSPIFDNESIKIGTFKANRSIDTLDIVKENIKFWKSYDGHKLPDKQVKRLYYNGTRTQNIIKMYINTPELIKFVREHANDYKTLNRKDVPSCITIIIFERIMKVISDIIDLYGLYCEFYKNIQ